MLDLPKVSKSGYTFESLGAQILLFHGYTGTPYDLKPLAIFLHKLGYKVVVPLLKGHGKKSSLLNKVTYEDWLKQANLAYKNLDPNKPIYVGGLSMGALLAICLASKYKNIKKIILLSAALELFLWINIAIEYYKKLPLKLHFSWPKMGGQSDIADEKAKKICPSYKDLPFFGLYQFNELRKMAILQIPNITCPIFAAFGAKDMSIEVQASKRHLVKACSKKMIIKNYQKSKHILPLDLERDMLCEDVKNFLKSK